MEVKSVSDCLNIFDYALVENSGKYFGILCLENIYKYLLENGQSDFIEYRVALSNVLSQVNSIKKNKYRFAEEDIKSEYIQLRKLFLVWLIECSTKTEVDDQQKFKIYFNKYCFIE